MRLEEEIKQKKFRNEYHKLVVNLIYTHGWLHGMHSEFFKKFGLTGTQFNILRILRGMYPEPCSGIVLKERMLDKMSDVSRLIERLRVKGYVERKHCGEDRRRLEVSISEKGLQILKEIDKVESQFDNNFYGLNDSEAKSLNTLLDKLRG